MIDTHAHINIDPLLKDIDNIILRAKEKGVKKIIAVGMNAAANKQGMALLTAYEEIYGSVGIHPSEVDELFNAESLKKWAQHPKVVAIGEIGIDLYWRTDNLKRQKEYFIKQIEIAIECNLPVIIHSRNSADVIYDIVKKYPKLKGVMHCYSEHIELLDKFIDLGFYIGVGGVVTFKNAGVVKDIVKQTPLEKIVIETDSPYLTPVPHRGKQNEPKNVYYVCEMVAKIKGRSFKEINDATTKNAHTLFSKLTNL